jgi:hypothetical protein
MPKNCIGKNPPKCVLHFEQKKKKTQKKRCQRASVRWGCEGHIVLSLYGLERESWVTHKERASNACKTVAPAAPAHRAAGGTSGGGCPTLILHLRTFCSFNTGFDCSLSKREKVHRTVKRRDLGCLYTMPRKPRLRLCKNTHAQQTKKKKRGGKKKGKMPKSLCADGNEQGMTKNAPGSKTGYR